MDIFTLKIDTITNKMPKSVNMGGQRRTIEVSCGWRSVGHPNEVNKKFELHKKHCKICGSSNYSPSPFDRTAGDINGWKGQFHNHNTKKESITSVSVNGVKTNIHLKGVKRTEISDKINDKILNDDELVALFSK